MTRFIAHRGLSAVYYQNSEKAFQAAADSSFFYGIETDVWFTSDNKWVCCHDNNPFANETISVSKITLEEALKLPMNLNKIGSAKIEGESYICTLEKYLKICKGGDKVPVIELKCTPSREQLKDLIAIVDSIIGIENVVFISFHYINMARLRSLNKKIRLQVLGRYPTSGRAFLSKGYDVDLMWNFCPARLIRKAHRMGHEVNIWTVNQLAVVRHFMYYAVDYITTNKDFSGKI